MIEYYDISGCYVLRPWSYAVWESIKGERGVVCVNGERGVPFLRLTASAYAVSPVL